MKNKLKFILLSCIVLAIAMLASSCSGDLSPFKDHDKNGYTVSVKYDANGGNFTTNTSVIIDTYDLTSYKTDANGNKNLKLFSPDSSMRGENQSYNASRLNYYLAGWYTERTEIKDESGNVTGYTYGGRWDFEADTLPVKADGEYTSAEPVITLYAAWVPAFKYEFYTVGADGKATLSGTMDVNPLDDTAIRLPSFNEETGRVGAANDFPEIEGKTYDKIYLDEGKTNEITGVTLSHSGSFNIDTATLEDPIMKIYSTVTDGVIYRITKPEQLIKNPSSDATYIIESDLDFSGKAWPAIFFSGEFNGSIAGNGHTVSNVSMTQSNTADTAVGLFGTVGKDASVTDITFDSVKLTVKGYSLKTNAAFGIFAGEIADGAELTGITLKNATLVITKGLSLTVALNNRDPRFGLVCAVGDTDGISFSTDNVKVDFAGADATVYKYTPDEHGRFTLTPDEG